MDEPFASLDALTREDLQNLTRELCAERNITLVLVTHNIEEAAAMGENILVLGAPPNQQTCTFANPAVQRPGYRGSSSYLRLCRELRLELAHEQA